jgi:hypothetical protein
VSKKDRLEKADRKPSRLYAVRTGNEIPHFLRRAFELSLVRHFTAGNARYISPALRFRQVCAASPSAPGKQPKTTLDRLAELR